MTRAAEGRDRVGYLGGEFCSDNSESCAGAAGFRVAAVIVATLMCAYSLGFAQQCCGEPFCCDPPSDPNCLAACGVNEASTNTETLTSHDLTLTVECSAPPSVPEAGGTITNGSNRLEYLIKYRAEVVCPPDPGQVDICMCTMGYADWFDIGVNVCNGYSCNDAPCPGFAPEQNDSDKYPKQLSLSTGCTQEGDWISCEKVIGPGQSINLAGLRPLNTCCDCDRIRKNIVCGEVDVKASRRTGSSKWNDITDPGYDLLVECRSEVPPHDVDGVIFTCFQPLASYCPDLSALNWARPVNPSCRTNPLFMFSAPGGSPQLQCRIDNASWAPCSSPYTPAVTNGAHAFYVRDRLAANPTVDKYEWTTDTSAPCGTGQTAFRIIKSIFGGLVNGQPVKNLLSLPYQPEFPNSNPTDIEPEKLCKALNLSGSATVTQYDALGGAYTHRCSADPATESPRFPNDALLPFKGVEISEPEPGEKKGYIVGREVEGQGVRIESLGPGTVGRNLFPVLYHGTAVTPQDLCVQCGLSSQAQITRYNSQTGQVQDHICGHVTQWNLVRGEAVLIQEPGISRTCTQPHY